MVARAFRHSEVIGHVSSTINGGIPRLKAGRHLALREEAEKALSIRLGSLRSRTGKNGRYDLPSANLHPHSPPQPL